MFESHKEFGREIWFAGGAWCWNGFAPFGSYSLTTMKPAMESVAEHGIDHVMITMWGDNGKECSFFSLLPVLYSIRQYADGNFDEKRIEKGFFETFGLSYKDFMALELPNRTKKTRDGNDVENPCKSLCSTIVSSGFSDDAMEAEGKIPYGEYAAKLAGGRRTRGGVRLYFPLSFQSLIPSWRPSRSGRPYPQGLQRGEQRYSGRIGQRGLRRSARPHKGVFRFVQGIVV